jgi:hypothetical protein
VKSSASAESSSRNPAPASASPEGEAISASPQAALAEGSGAHSQASNPLRAWEQVMTALADERKLGLVTLYQTAKVLEWEGDRVVVGFPKDGMTSEIASDKEKVAEMKAFLDKHCGKSIDFKVKLLSESEEADAVSILEDAKRRAEEEAAAKREEAREHPITKAVLDTFGASIKEIRTDV